MDGTNKIDLAEGMEVSVNPQNDRSRKERVKGCIAEIITTSEKHSHGILVRLDNGVVGRVKEIIDGSTKLEPSFEKGNHGSHSETSLVDIILEGENHFVEFKSSALWSERLSQNEIIKTKSGDLKQYGRNTSKIIFFFC